MSKINNAFQYISKFTVQLFTVTEQRKKDLYTEIVFGSDPKSSYYLLLLLSAMIATFGLIANSPAVVIGAMLVSPLMMPIFGISLSLITGDTSLFRSAMLAEIGGIAVVIASSFLVGISPFTFEMTPEILSRTSPNLLDLFVAALAGFAGCLAMIDQKISPILPGIAISTALTPPLAACGLCFAFGAYEGGMGAFILFMANFLTILFVASIVFVVSGFFQGEFNKHKRIFAKRFSLAAISMIVIVFFLSNAMIRLIDEKRTTSAIKKAMLAKISTEQNIDIKEITLDRSSSGSELNALVVIDAPKEPEPRLLKAIEEDIFKRLEKRVNVFVQARITKSVSSSKDKLIHLYRSADGINEVRTAKDVELLNVAHQIIRERLQEIPCMQQISDIELRYTKDGKKVIYTTIQGPIRPFPGGVRNIEKKIRKILDDPDIYLVARYIESCEISSHGVNEFNFEKDKISPEAEKLQKLARDEIKKLNKFSIGAIRAAHIKGRWLIMAELSGGTVLTSEEANTIQSKLREIAKKDLLFMAFSKAEAMVGDKKAELELRGILRKPRK